MIAYTTADNRITLHHGRAIDILPSLADAEIDAVLTDPPCAVTGASASTAGKGTEEPFDTQFYESWFAELLAALYPIVAPHGAMWWTSDWRGALAAERAFGRTGGWHNKARLAAIGIWDRGGLGMGYVLRKTFECFCVAAWPEWKRTATDEPDIWRIPWAPAERTEHRAQKPVELFDRALTLIGGTSILDPFAGSATTALVAIRRGLKWTGIEHDAAHVETAANRINAELARFPLLERRETLRQRELITTGPERPGDPPT